MRTFTPSTDRSSTLILIDEAIPREVAERVRAHLGEGATILDLRTVSRPLATRASHLDAHGLTLTNWCVLMLLLAALVALIVVNVVGTGR